MDLPSQLPCWSCGRLVNKKNRKMMPTLGLHDLAPTFHNVRKSDIIKKFGFVPDGVYTDKKEYEKAKKKYICENWWCENCYKQGMKELENG